MAKVTAEGRGAADLEGSFSTWFSIVENYISQQYMSVKIFFKLFTSIVDGKEVHGKNANRFFIFFVVTFNLLPVRVQSMPSRKFRQKSIMMNVFGVWN